MSNASDWPTVKLGEVVEINPRLQTRPADDDNITFIPMTAVEEAGFISSKELRTYGEVKKGYTPFQKDDLLLAKITPCFQNKKISAADIDTEVGIGSTEFHVLRTSNAIDMKYLLHLLRQDSVVSEGEKCMTGSGGQRRVPRWFLENLSIPLPPLAEQQRIAEILDTVATTISSSREQLVALSQIQENLLTETDQVKYVPLGDLAQIRSGTVKPNEHPYCDLPHVAPDNIESGTGRLQGINTASEDGVTSNKYAFCAGDLLYSKIRPYLNKFAIPQFDGVCSADMYALVPQEPATAEYLAMTLQSPLFLAYAEQQSGRASIPKINRKSLTAFPVPFHSEAEIQRVTEIYQETETARSAVERKLDTLQELQNSLSTRAFAGQL